MAIDSARNALQLVDLAMRTGDQKHGFEEWKKNGKPSRLNEISHVAGADRHLTRHMNGESVDHDSKLPALAHVVARALMALEMHLQHQPFKRCEVTKMFRKSDIVEHVCDLPNGHNNEHYDAGINEWWTP